MYKTSHKNITDLRSEIVRFAEIHFAQQMEGYDGYIGIKSRRGKYFKNEYTPKQSCFDRHIMKYQHFGQRDLYISKNIHTGFSLSKKNILAFYNIVVDIDAHGALPEHLAEDTPKLLHFLQSEVFGQDGVPVPNTIVYTGRGIQLWYAIDSLAASMADQYILASRFIAGKIHEAISSSPMLDLYSVDMAASCKTAGLCRMPGTYNSAARCFGEIQFIHDNRLNVLDFCNYEIDPPKAVKPAIWKEGYTGIAHHRREMIEKLLQMRLKDGDDCKGMRDLFCFVYFCAGFSGDIDEAYEATKRLNRRFPQPLSNRELGEYLSTSLARAAEGTLYKFRNQTLVDYLQISEDECRKIGLSCGKKQPARPGLTRKMSEGLIKKICDLAKAGLNKSQIAKSLNISVPTVSKYLKLNRVKTDKEALHLKMKKAIRRGMDLKEFMSAFGASKSLYYKIKEKIAIEIKTEQERLNRKREEKAVRKKEKERRQKLAADKRASFIRMSWKSYQSMKRRMTYKITPLLHKEEGKHGDDLIRSLKRKTGFSLRSLRYWLTEFYPDLLRSPSSVPSETPPPPLPVSLTGSGTLF